MEDQNDIPLSHHDDDGSGECVLDIRLMLIINDKI